MPQRAPLSRSLSALCLLFFFFQAEDGIRDSSVTGVQTCALPISQPMRAAQSPSLSYFFASFAYTSTICLTTSVTSGQRGILFGNQGITIFENFGVLMRLDIFPPTKMAMPSPALSAKGRAIHME